jgi:hypothetical protein
MNVVVTFAFRIKASQPCSLIIRHSYPAVSKGQGNSPTSNAECRYHKQEGLEKSHQKRGLKTDVQYKLNTKPVAPGRVKKFKHANSRGNTEVEEGGEIQ